MPQSAERLINTLRRLTVPTVEPLIRFRRNIISYSRNDNNNKFTTATVLEYYYYYYYCYDKSNTPTLKKNPLRTEAINIFILFYFFFKFCVLPLCNFFFSLRTIEIVTITIVISVTTYLDKFIRRKLGIYLQYSTFRVT